jgi:DNA-binding NarL/FixJ family response regulator
MTAIRVIADGDALLAPSITRRLVEEFARRPAPRSGRPPELSALTTRELEVLTRLARGLSNAEIAATMVLGEATVKTRRQGLDETRASRPRASRRRGVQSGLIHPGETSAR